MHCTVLQLRKGNYRNQVLTLLQNTLVLYITRTFTHIHAQTHILLYTHTHAHTYTLLSLQPP